VTLIGRNFTKHTRTLPICADWSRGIEAVGDSVQPGDLSRMGSHYVTTLKDRYPLTCGLMFLNSRPNMRLLPNSMTAGTLS